MYVELFKKKQKIRKGVKYEEAKARLLVPASAFFSFFWFSRTYWSGRAKVEEMWKGLLGGRKKWRKP